MPSTPRTQRLALLSVSDKTGLAPLAQALVEQYHYDLLATGGTYTALKAVGVPVKELSEVTGFGDLLDGRVKTLHPHVFAGILAKRDDDKHLSQVEFLIDTVVVNLYPFEQTVAKTSDEAEIVENIDIGGSTLIRAAAKNHASVNVLCRPDQYEAFLQELSERNGETRLEFRKVLARQAFQHSLAYESAIAAYMTKHFPTGGETPDLPETWTLPLQKIQDLRYGENPHQKAALYGLGTREADFELLHGKPLSYNNILDMEAGWKLVCEFTEKPTAAIIKHNTPCGVASSEKTLLDAYQTAFDVDPLSAFGGIVALNRPVDADTAYAMKDVFLEVIVAPGFSPDALEILSAKKNLRLVRRTLVDVEDSLVGKPELKQVSDTLFLVQVTEREKTPTDLAEILQVVSQERPTREQLDDMLFAWKVVKHVKSNAVVLVKNGKTVGIGGGQTSRIGAMEHAIKQACDESADAVMASDGFLPQADNIHAAVQARVKAIIQPGGSIKDSEIIDLANQFHIAMVTTGIREFRH